MLHIVPMLEIYCTFLPKYRATKTQPNLNV